MNRPILSVERQGELFTFGSILTYSWAPIVGIFLVQMVGAPFWAVALSHLGGAGILAVLMTYRNRWHDFWTNEGFMPMIWTTVLIILFGYGFVFWGYQYTDSNSAAILTLVQILVGYVIFHVIGGERSSKIGIIGALLMLGGSALVIFKGTPNINIGNIAILVGLSVAAFGDIFAKKARRTMTAGQMAFFRCLFGGLMMLFLALLFEPVNLPGWNPLFVLTLFAYGALFLGIEKFFWYEGIHRINVSKALTLSMLAPMLTMAYNAMFFSVQPSFYQLLGVVPMVIGAILIVNFKNVPVED